MQAIGRSRIGYSPAKHPDYDSDQYVFAYINKPIALVSSFDFGNDISFIERNQVWYIVENREKILDQLKNAYLLIRYVDLIGFDVLDNYIFRKIPESRDRVLDAEYIPDAFQYLMNSDIRVIRFKEFSMDPIKHFVYLKSEIKIENPYFKGIARTNIRKTIELADLIKSRKKKKEIISKHSFQGYPIPGDTIEIKYGQSKISARINSCKIYKNIPDVFESESLESFLPINWEKLKLENSKESAFYIYKNMFRFPGYVNEQVIVLELIPESGLCP